MSKPEQGDLPRPKQGEQSRWNPVGQWLEDRKSRQAAKASELAFQASEKAAQPERQSIIRGCITQLCSLNVPLNNFDAGNLGVIKTSDSLSGLVTCTPQFTDTTGAVIQFNDYSHSMRKWTDNSALDQTLFRGDVDRTVLLTDVATRSVELVSNTDGQIKTSEKKNLHADGWDTVEIPVVSFEGHVDDERFQVTIGRVEINQDKDIRTNASGNSFRGQIYVLERGNTAYVITEKEVHRYYDGRNYYGNHLISLRKVELPGGEAYDPKSKAQYKEGNLTEEDIKYLGRAAEAVKTATPVRWGATYWDYGKGMTPEEIQNSNVKEEERRKAVTEKQAEEEQNRLDRKDSTEVTEGVIVEDDDYSSYRSAAEVTEPVKESQATKIEGTHTWDEEKRLIAEAWREMRQDWKEDASDVAEIIKGGSGVTIEAANKTGKSTFLIPELVERLNEQGYLVAVINGGVTLRIGDAREHILYFFSQALSWSDEGGYFEHKNRFPVGPNDTKLVENLIATNKGRSVLIIDEAGQVLEDDVPEAKSREYLSDWFAQLADMGITPVLINAAQSKKFRAHASSIYGSVANQQGIPLIRYEMKHDHVRPELARRFLEIFPVSQDLIDFMTREENKAFYTPGVLGRLSENMGAHFPAELRISDLTSLRNHLEEDLDNYFGRQAMFGGSKVDMLAALRNLESFRGQIVSNDQEKRIPDYN